MKISQLISPSNLSKKYYELKETRDRTKQLEVQIDQLYSLLRLKEQIPAIPPPHMQIRVAGAYYKDFFLHGQSLINQLNEGLATVGVKQTLVENDAILDFGCGCGRTLIPLAIRSDNPSKVHGVDIDPEAIGWLADNYPQVGSVKLNSTWPQMNHVDETFDVVYAVSVFTHLPEAMEQAWLADICRVLRKGGHALLTVHGEAFFELISSSAAQEVQEKGFVYVSEDMVTHGLPEFYKNSYHTMGYIQERWSKYFDVLTIIPKGVDRQDLVVLCKR